MRSTCASAIGSSIASEDRKGSGVRRNGSVAAIDVGTSKICTLVGGYDAAGELRIVARGIVASHGMSKGVVSDAAKTTAAIAASLRAAEETLGGGIDAVTVGIAGSHIACLNARGTIALPSLQRPIMREDINRALDDARTTPIPNNREVLHAIPRLFVIDGEDTPAEPVGRYGHRLDVETHIITGSLAAIQDLTHCVESAGVQVEALVLEPLAAADAVLDEEERRHGVLLIDIGGGTTSLALFIEGAVQHTAVFPLGGNQITNDVAYGLRAPFSAAEEVKEEYGHAIPAKIDPEETFHIAGFGGGRSRLAGRRRLSDFIAARAEEILERVRDEIVRLGSEELISAGAVLTGGTACLAGIDDLAERILQMPVRLGVPVGIQDLDAGLELPAFSASIGLLGWAAREQHAVLKPVAAVPVARARPARLRPAVSEQGVRQWLGKAWQSVLPRTP